MGREARHEMWLALKNSCNCQAKKDKTQKKETAEVGNNGRRRGNLSSRKHSHSGMKTNVRGENENRQLVSEYITPVSDIPEGCVLFGPRNARIFTFSDRLLIILHAMYSVSNKVASS